MDDEEAFLYGDEAAPAVPTAGPSAFEAELKASDVPLGETVEGQDAMEREAMVAPDMNESQEEGEEEEESDEDLDIILDGDTSRPPPATRALPVPSSEPPRDDSKGPPKEEATTEYRPHDRGDPNALIKPSMLSITPAGPGSTERNRIPTPEGIDSAAITDMSTKAPGLDAPPDVNAEGRILSGYDDKEGTALMNYDFENMSESDKGWSKPGAHVADWFNYGFDEATWRTYVMKQKKLRGEENVATNPFAPFALGNLQEAWASLPPELKGVMMQTVMSAGSGVPSGMNGMMGMPPMGMDSMMMNGFGMGMSQPPVMPGMMGMSNPMEMPSQGVNHESVPPSDADGGGETPAQPYFNEGEDGSRGMYDPHLNTQGFASGMDQGMSFNGEPSTYMSGQQGYQPEMNAGPPGQGTRGRGRGRGGRGGAGGFLAAAAAAARGRGRGLSSGVPQPVASATEGSPERDRAGRSPLPANIPTGPRNAPLPRGPRAGGYHDKDAAGGRGDEGLDYGGGGANDSPQDDRKRRHRDYDERSEVSRDRDGSEREGHRSSRSRRHRHRGRSRSRSIDSPRSPRDRERDDDPYRSRGTRDSRRRSHRDRDRDDDRYRERDEDRYRDREDDRDQVAPMNSEDEFASALSSRKRKAKEEKSRDDRSSRSKRERAE